MRTRDVPRAVSLVARHPHLVRLLVTSAARLSLHGVERRLPSGWSFPPRSIQVMVTDTCNLTCRMCQYAHSESPAYGLRRVGLMPLEVFSRVVETTPGHPLIALTGGEPLLHPQIHEFIRIARSRGLPSSLTTNGWFLQDKAAGLCESGLDVLVVSIDGDEQDHDRIRGRGAFSRAAAGIREILRQPQHPILAITCAVNDLNSRSLDNLHELAASLHVDALNFNHLWIQTDAMVIEQGRRASLPKAHRVTWEISTRSIDPERVHDSIQRVRRRKGQALVNAYPELNQQETEIYYRQPERLVKERTTSCVWFQVRVWPDGDVRMCRESSCGNVCRESLGAIWNGPRLRAFRRYLSRRGVCPICARCCFFFTRV